MECLGGGTWCVTGDRGMSGVNSERRRLMSCGCKLMRRRKRRTDPIRFTDDAPTVGCAYFRGKRGTKWTSRGPNGVLR